MTRIADRIEVKQNLRLIARERGKIVARREGHNIWLDTGREWLAELISYLSFVPTPVPEEDYRIKYMGLGIGGNRQLAPGVADAEPMFSHYPGTNSQSDTLRTVTSLERPVRVTGGSVPTPGEVGDMWLARVQAPATHNTPTSATFIRTFTEVEVSYGVYLTVPLSEIGLFTAGAVENSHSNIPVAYDTFDTISKTSALQLEVEWTIQF